MLKQYSGSQVAPPENKAHLKCVQNASALKSLIQPFPELLLGQCLPLKRSHPDLQHRNKKGHYRLSARPAASEAPSALAAPASPQPARALPGQRPLPRAERRAGSGAGPGRAEQGSAGQSSAGKGTARQYRAVPGSAAPRCRAEAAEASRWRRMGRARRFREGGRRTGRGAG